ncbi:hypothetical protein FNV43_RR00213 [Rhamnella rubrinervis]|uniref:Uncharacterized protein n=1 Tax=Rhamnella rubrinervis TaxID=2594499 RepID=A0A8K0HPY0_9ROSA|nr:hypothetical protein FNV43_RR00213 [Rhamnella rubrinervis]
MVRANLRYRNTLNQPMEICCGTYSTLLSTIKRMKDGGELMFWKNNYSEGEAQPPKRGIVADQKTKDHLQARPVDPAMHRGST